MSVEMSELDQYLIEPRTKQQIETHFLINNDQSFKLLRWAIKGGFIERFSARIDGKVGQRNFFYIIKK